MKFLIYGHKGWIGSQVISELTKNKYSFILAQSRTDNIEDVEKEIKEHEPTNIMMFTGRTHGTHDGKYYPTIDYLEQSNKLVDNVRDNLFGPIGIAILCKKYNVHLTYLGTGCIFQYDDQHPYGEEINGFTEEDKPNFFGSSYSTVKGFTDRLMHQFDDSVLNLRIRMPITGEANTRNFITKIVTYEKVCSVPNSMTVLPELIPFAIDMAKNKIVGTVNLTNPGLINHNEILEMYKEIVDPEFTWKNFTLEEQSKVLAGGRSNDFLDTSKLESMYNVKNIKDSIKDCLHHMKTIN
jgi:3,5-epimerase/4-reductase